MKRTEEKTEKEELLERIPEIPEDLEAPEKSFNTPTPVEDDEGHELTLGDLMKRYTVTIADVGKTAQEIINEIETDGVDDKTKLTEQETELLDAILFEPYAAFKFRISKLIIKLRSISSQMSISSERLLVELVGETKLTQQEMVVIDSRMQLARYLLSYGDKNFDHDDYESIPQLKRRYEMVSKMPVSVLDHCNTMVQRFVGMQSKVLNIKTITNF